MGSRYELLRRLRLDKRLTQAEVAKKMKVSQSYYSSVEGGLKPAAEVEEATKVVNGMRRRMDRTSGGDQKAGREK